MTGPREYLNAKRVLQFVALGLVMGAAVCSCAVPAFTIAQSDSSGHSTISTRTLLDVQGPGYLLVFIALVAVAAVPLFLRGTRWSVASVMVPVAITTFAILGSMTIGAFFLPAAVASSVAALLPTRARDHTPMVSDAA